MYPMTRREFLRLIGWSAAAMVGTSCGRAPVVAPAQTRAPRTVSLRLAGGDNGYPTPFAYVRGPGYVRKSLIFDTLIWKDSQGYIPWLATDWKLLEDEKTWRFKLREGVHWHDGQPLTPDDVIFSFEYARQQPLSQPHTRGVEFIRLVHQPKADCVEIVLSQPYAPFLANLAGAMPIIPKHIWAKVTRPAEFVAPEAVIGSGPYQLTAYDQKTGAYAYAANEKFWLGKPFVREIDLKPVANELTALENASIDGAVFPYEGGIADEMLVPFQKAPCATLTAPGEWNAALHFNLALGAPLDRVKFRQACAYAIDREEIVKQVLFGRGDPGCPNWLAPSNPWHNPHAEAYVHNPGKANNLLGELGYRDTDGDGIREMPGGKRLQMSLLYDSDGFSGVAEMVSSMLRNVGIDVNRRPLPRAALDDATANGNYEMAITYYGALGSDPDLMRQVFSSKSVSRTFSRVIGYNNPRFDELADQQLVETEDAKRKALVYQMQEILAQDVPVLPLYYPTRCWIYRADALDNWYYTPGGIAMGPPFTLNKHAFVTGQTIGLQIRG